MKIERMINGFKHEITLDPSEIDTAYRIVETDYFKQDFISMCKDQKKSDLIPEVLSSITIENQTELLNHAYEYYHKIHDCNLDYNSMLDSVIDDAATWYQSELEV